MAPAKELARLALQKRILLAESEARRLVLAAELSRITKPVLWMDRSKVQARPVLVAASTVLTYFYARRSKGLTRWIARALGAARLYRSVSRFLGRPGKR